MVCARSTDKLIQSWLLISATMFSLARYLGTCVRRATRPVRRAAAVVASCVRKCCGGRRNTSSSHENLQIPPTRRRGSYELVQPSPTGGGRASVLSIGILDGSVDGSISGFNHLNVEGRLRRGGNDNKGAPSGRAISAALLGGLGMTSGGDTDSDDEGELGLVRPLE